MVDQGWEEEQVAQEVKGRPWAKLSLAGSSDQRMAKRGVREAAERLVATQAKAKGVEERDAGKSLEETVVVDVCLMSKEEGKEEQGEPATAEEAWNLQMDLDGFQEMKVDDLGV